MSVVLIGPDSLGHGDGGGLRLGARFARRTLAAPLAAGIITLGITTIALGWTVRIIAFRILAITFGALGILALGIFTVALRRAPRILALGIVAVTLGRAFGILALGILAVTFRRASGIVTVGVVAVTPWASRIVAVRIIAVAFRWAMRILAIRILAVALGALGILAPGVLTIALRFVAFGVTTVRILAIAGLARSTVAAQDCIPVVRVTATRVSVMQQDLQSRRHTPWIHGPCSGRVSARELAQQSLQSQQRLSRGRKESEASRTSLDSDLRHRDIRNAIYSSQCPNLHSKEFDYFSECSARRCLFNSASAHHDVYMSAPRIFNHRSPTSFFSGSHDLGISYRRRSCCFK